MLKARGSSVEIQSSKKLTMIHPGKKLPFLEAEGKKKNICMKLIFAEYLQKK